MQAEVWQNSGLTPEICATNPDLSKFGIYRLLDTGKYEFLSYCTQVPGSDGKPVTAVQLYVSLNAKKFQAVLDDLLPAPKPGQSFR